ncbi:hypothetical protein FHR33_003521 [Nonomuraea dietziae]|uniref:Uncharacterized protein n=1 Tax=Nonomuraea dietziae TaxID=65515 RepID=A0A7W5V4F6_9ACTN|nr:hypothetical protein [Nonomuraea dietziae]
MNNRNRPKFQKCTRASLRGFLVRSGTSAPGAA